MKDEFIDMPTKGDSVRGILGALAGLIAVSLAISPRMPGHSAGPQILVVATLTMITLICIGTSKSRGGVALGILFIAAFRFLMAAFFYLAGVYRKY
jgi:hypothetical protein